MDINKLSTFLAVVNYGSFKEAAEHLFLSPRAVSKQMNQIEAELNIKLFDRQNNRTNLTPAGKAFTVTAQDIVNTYSNALTKIKTENQTHTKEIRLGISSLIQSTILQTALTNFIEKNSNIHFQIEEESGQRLVSLVNNNSLDFCITPFYKTQKSDIHLKNLKKIDLYTGELFLGISKVNPLSKQKSISLNQIKHLKILYYTPFGSHYLKQTFLEKFAGLLSENQIEPVSTLEQRNLLVAINKGVAFYPDIVRDQEESENPLINFLPIHDECNKYYASSLWYRTDNKNPMLKEIINELKKQRHLVEDIEK